MSGAVVPSSGRFGGSRRPPRNRFVGREVPPPSAIHPHPPSNRISVALRLNIVLEGRSRPPFSGLRMLHKGRQQIHRFRFTPAHRLPTRRARHFLTNYIRTVRSDIPSAPLRAALGYLQWRLLHSYHGEDRISLRTFCFVTGRARGTSRRFTVSRTRVRQFAAEGRLFGLRKSS